MNIHPLFVHFPIALLVVYTFLEVGSLLVLGILRVFRREGPSVGVLLSGKSFHDIKAFLVVMGTALAFVTLQTGEWAEHALRTTTSEGVRFATSSSPFRLIEMHSSFATASVAVFTILAVAYICRLAWFRKFKIFNFVSELVLNPWIRVILALVGAVLILITGALGGAITYGPTTDPFVSMIYGWFF